ncbi:hypothetical protein ZWY2020_032871 [Hordeum vulgare]|nr:hypothetical protein ZWY2020_032871 [Hordeum vulgare]
MAEEPGNYGDYYVLDIDDHEPDEPADDVKSNDDIKIILLGELGLCLLLVICAALSFFIRGLEPGYSVQLTGVQGLDPSQNAAVSPTFNLTVHVNNKQHIRRVCQGKSTVIVYYKEASEGFKETSIGWGKLPAFCVDRRSARDLHVSLSNQGVFISRRLRENMESHRQDAAGGDRMAGRWRERVREGRAPTSGAAARLARPSGGAAGRSGQRGWSGGTT